MELDSMLQGTGSELSPEIRRNVGVGLRKGNVGEEGYKGVC